MSTGNYIKWMPAFFAVVSLVVIQFVHFTVSEPVHADDAIGHAHDAPASHDGAPTDDHIETAHCASHGACHLLLHAISSAAPSDMSACFQVHANLRPSSDWASARSVQPPTPPPLA